MNLSKKIQIFRVKNDLTQEQFAKLVNINVTTLNLIENEKYSYNKSKAVMKIELFLENNEV